MRPTYVVSILQLLLVLLCWLQDAGAFLLPVVGGIDLEYMSHAGWRELREYFPRYYLVVFLSFLFVKYGLISSLILGAVLWHRARQKLLSLVRWVFPTHVSGLHILGAVIGATLVALVAYGVLRPMVNDAFRFQLVLVRSYLLLLVSTVVVCSSLNSKKFGRFLSDFLYEPTMPQVLALFRIFFFGYLSLLYVREFLPIASSLGSLEKVGLPTVGWIVQLVPVNPGLYAIACVVGAGFSLLTSIGLFTRLSMSVNAIAVFYVVATPNFFGKLEHHQLIIWIAWILAVSPCFAVLSIDARRNPTADWQQHGRYGFPLKVIWLHFGLIYFFAGFHKLWLCGFDWALTDSMINQVRIEWFENYWTVSDWRLDKIPWLLKLGGLVVIYFELAFVFLLLFKKLRWLAIFGGLAMHNVIGKLMFISFSQDLQAFYTAFIPWGRFLKRSPDHALERVEHSGLPISSLTVALPLALLGMNTIYGIFNISSYPFSVYPVYAEIIPSHVRSFEYRLRDRGFEHIDVWEKAKDNHYNWERFARTEYHTIRNWQSGLGKDSAQVRILWKRLALEVPEVSQADSIDVFIVERSLDPDSAHMVVSETYIMSIVP